MNKRGIFGVVLSIIGALLILFLIYAAFLRPEIYEDMWDSISNTFSLPEQDPYPWEVNINAQRAQAMDVFQDMVKQFNKTAENRAAYVPDEIPITETKGNCFGGFSAMPASFFDNKFSIRIRNESTGMSLQLFELRQLADQDNSENKVVTRMPASSKYFVYDYSPCVIYDLGAESLLRMTVIDPDLEGVIDKFVFQQNVEGINLYEQDKISFFRRRFDGNIFSVQCDLVSRGVNPETLFKNHLSVDRDFA